MRASFTNVLLKQDYSKRGATTLRSPPELSTLSSLPVAAASCIPQGFEVPFCWLLKLVFLINKEGKIHEFFRHRSAQAATLGQ